MGLLNPTSQISIGVLLFILVLCGHSIAKPIQILPRETNQQNSRWPDAHLIYLPLGNLNASNTFIYLHISGSYGVPRDSMQILQVAAEAGMIGIGLSYDNTFPDDLYCGKTNLNDHCYERARLEIIEGIDYSSSIHVVSWASITGRLSDLLHHLIDEHSYFDWSSYLKGQKINWEKFVVGGYSQGGGNAALIGKLYKTHGVLLFSSVTDDPKISSWQKYLQFNEGLLTRPFNMRSGSAKPLPPMPNTTATPIDRYIGLVNVYDPSCKDIQENWLTMGLTAGGVAQFINSTLSGRTLSSRMLCARLESSYLPGFSATTVIDTNQQFDSKGMPVMRTWKVWRSMFDTLLFSDEDGGPEAPQVLPFDSILMDNAFIDCKCQKGPQVWIWILVGLGSVALVSTVLLIVLVACTKRTHPATTMRD